MKSTCEGFNVSRPDFRTWSIRQRSVHSRNDEAFSALLRQSSLEVTEPRSIRTCYDMLGLGKHFAMHHIERA